MTVANIQRVSGVQNAIQLASQRTGIDFNYLLGQAQVESGLNASARAGTSSATGLYQFIEQSWLGVVKSHGAEHGMAWAADSITQTSSGRYVVSDPSARKAILGLRNDATASSLMAAEHASDNKDALSKSLDRDVTGTDLYMAHFLGIGGAKKFLGAMDANADRSAASLFPAAARANRGVFYAADGSARSLGDVYQRFSAKLDKGAAAVGATGFASRAMDSLSLDPNMEVVLGSEATGGDRQWLASTLDRFTGAGRSTTADAALLRPNPDNARLAYLMLAQLGGNV
ncbi:lytic transglycosylase domain-containing protein [Sphingomonas donggukensis]|uniref:Lytic transglycosylase domain-containing protein n=1 Tax=Sphingomonas donggukensis TaxID=2949093 RepID=A0ABY4TT12_9SPHN|nr:lytic transglycosylase domain-containing protein [Sphingomonas donggukensis]URW75548.1 lytic transglycosylase domain-containing protein [Sphingomonas donggukensis]